MASELLIQIPMVIKNTNGQYSIRNIINIIGHYYELWIKFVTSLLQSVNFIHQWRDDLLFYFIFTLKNFAWNLQRGNRRINTFSILFWCVAWGSNPSFTSNKPTYYLLNCSDSLRLSHRRNISLIFSIWCIVWASGLGFEACPYS